MEDDDDCIDMKEYENASTKEARTTQLSQMYESLLKEASGECSANMGRDNQQQKRRAKENSESEGNKKAKAVSTETEQPVENPKFKRGDKGPFIIHVRQTGEATQRPLMILEVGRLMTNINIKYDLIEPYSRKVWKLTFYERETANNALSNKYLEKKELSAFIPRETLSRKGVIHGIPIEISKEEFLQEINQQNPTLKAVDVYRFRRRVVIDNKSELVETQSICLTVRNKDLPAYVFFLRARIGIDPFIPAIRQCWKCGKVGHSTKFCKDV